MTEVRGGALQDCLNSLAVARRGWCQRVPGEGASAGGVRGGASLRGIVMRVELAGQSRRMR